VVAVLTTFTMTAMATRAIFARPSMLSAVAMRWRPRRAHPLGVHPVDDAVELFNDSIEAAGGIA
jgi:hypothetical protein